MGEVCEVICSCCLCYDYAAVDFLSNRTLEYRLTHNLDRFWLNDRVLPLLLLSVVCKRFLCKRSYSRSQKAGILPSPDPKTKGRKTSLNHPKSISRCSLIRPQYSSISPKGLFKGIPTSMVQLFGVYGKRSLVFLWSQLEHVLRKGACEPGFCYGFMSVRPSVCIWWLLMICTMVHIPDPCANPKNRSTLRFYDLRHGSSIGIQKWGSTFWILPGVWVSKLLVG